MEPTLLSDLSEDDRRRVLAIGRRRTFEAGEILFHENDLADTFHLLRRGHVAIRTTTRSGDVVTLTILGPSATFGELALIHPMGRRTATAAALDAVETLSLHRTVFEELRSTHPTVDRLLVLALTERVHELSQQVRDAHFEPAEVRVLRQLIRLCRVYGDSQGSVSIPITQETLASLAGTTRPTVNRTLREEARRGHLELSRGIVTVTDLNGILRRARS